MNARPPATDRILWCGLAALAVGVIAIGSCKKTLEAAAPPAVEPATDEPAAELEPLARRGAATEARRYERRGHAVPYNDPEDDPALVDSYYQEAEHDGAAVAEEAPVERPTFDTIPEGRSFSVGPPNAGWLVNGKPCPLRGPHHRVLRRTVTRGYYFGGDDLVRIIVEGAAAVASAHPGAPLRVGNLSRQGGGKIGPSVSHQSGRDVDIGLYVTDLDGKSVDAPGFPKFDQSRGNGVDMTARFLFDVERNWAFVAALLGDDKVKLQWIFLDTPLKEMLLEYAIRTGADPKLVDQAEKVILRPKDSSPHADHFHIRIFCTPGDLEYGCKEYGPEWQWVRESRQNDQRWIEDRVERIMRGEEGLDLGAPTPGGQASADNAPPTTTSPEQLPDPPTDVPLRL